jgi:hypothetical protein
MPQRPPRQRLSSNTLGRSYGRGISPGTGEYAPSRSLYPGTRQGGNCRSIHPVRRFNVDGIRSFNKS